MRTFSSTSSTTGQMTRQYRSCATFAWPARRTPPYCWWNFVIPEHRRDFIGKWADLEMLLGANGRERTAAEYRALLGRAGFRMTRVVPTASPFSLVEAKPG